MSERAKEMERLLWQIAQRDELLRRVTDVLERADTDDMDWTREMHAAVNDAQALLGGAGDE